MLKISQVEPPSHAITLRFEGQLIGPWVVEARKTCESLLGEGRALKLDLAEVSFADMNGVRLVASLQSRGVTLVECPAFVAEQLKAIGQPNAITGPFPAA